MQPVYINLTMRVKFPFRTGLTWELRVVKIGLCPAVGHMSVDDDDLIQSNINHMAQL